MSFYTQSARNKIQSSSYWSHDGDPVYLFSNENVGDYVGRVRGIRGADVLAVAGSGDHAFDAYLAGARHVDTFDVNRNQAIVINKKAEMIRKLDYEAFKNLMIDVNILPYIFRVPNLALWALHAHRHLKRDEPGLINLNRAAAYVRNAENYNQLRELLPDKVNFIHSDIMDLHIRLTRKYDVIFLSNIINHMLNRSWLSERGYYVRFYETVVAPLADAALRPGGVICMDYRWYDPSHVYNIRDAVDFMNTQFAPNQFDVLSVCAVRNPMQSVGVRAPMDAVVTMTR